MEGQVIKSCSKTYCIFVSLNIGKESRNQSQLQYCSCNANTRRVSYHIIFLTKSLLAILSLSAVESETKKILHQTMGKFTRLASCSFIYFHSRCILIIVTLLSTIAYILYLPIIDDSNTDYIGLYYIHILHTFILIACAKHNETYSKLVFKLNKHFRLLHLNTSLLK